MLRQINENEIADAIDFAWRLCENAETNSYPVRNDKSKLEECFIDSFKYPNTDLLGFYMDGQLFGVIYYFIKKEDLYIQTAGIYIAEYIEEAMDEFILLLKENYKEFEVYFGYPKENQKALQYFEKHNYELIEDSTDMRLDSKDFIDCEISDDVELLGTDEFDEYAAFHDTYSEGMYWDSSHIRDTLDKWYIYVFKKKDRIEGSIFIRAESEKMLCVFGVFLTDFYKGNGVEQKLLVKALHEILPEKPAIETVVYFIDNIDVDEMNSAKNAGFKYFSGYQCYVVKL